MMGDYFDLTCVVERVGKNKLKITLLTELNDDFRIVATIDPDNVIGIETAIGGDGNEMDSPDLYELLSSLV
jgi:hypothetical protein